jgi:two-component system nitrogen regulation sensor histidine kinase GlnL
MAPEQLHTDLLGNLTTAIVLVAPDLSIRYINPAAEDLLKISGQRILNEPLQHVLHETDNNDTALIEAIKAKRAFTKRETKLRLASGQHITVDCIVTPTDDALILELQPLDRLLRISREEDILASQQTTQALVRGLAHEIKNPLGGVRGAAQLLAKELNEPDLHDYTNVIIEEADRLSKLVDNMLGPHQLPDYKSVNIHEVLERVKQLIQAESQGRLDIIRDYDPSIPELHGDKAQLIQAVLNIARNSLQALQESRQASPQLTFKSRTLRQLTIGNTKHRLVCRIDIIDNGPGIDPEILSAIFLPMISGRADGTGLGLAISQSIINQHQGIIQAKSESGETTFSLYIPLEPQSPTEQKS